MEKGKNGVEQSAIPEWMTKADESVVVGIKYGNTGFIRKTINDISKVIQNDLLSEKVSRKNGLLQSVNPRTKLVTIIPFMIFAGITQSFLSLLFLAAAAVIAARLSRVSLWEYVKRVWMILPLITLVMSIPAATSLFIPGKPVLYLYSGLSLGLKLLGLPREVYFSMEGVAAVLKMSMRIGVSLSYGYLLVITTRWAELAKALRVLKAPQLAVAILDMTYRFIFVLVKISIEIFEARLLRSVGKIQNRENRKFVSNSIAFLFIKSNHASDEIYDAMVCRGYTGEPVALNNLKTKGLDYIWIMDTGIILLILLFFEFIYK